MLRAVLLFLVEAYQRMISPVLPSACKFYPTCSEYAKQAIARYGAARGTWMAARAISSGRRNQLMHVLLECGGKYKHLF